jgi:hypothetical protein
MNNPRKLTEQEIDDIVSVIPPVKSAAKDVSEIIRKNIQERLKEQLREIILTPLAINDMKREILNIYENSLIDQGTPVGIMAAEALGHPITQMALNSFKTSGTSKQIVTGVDRVRNLVNISKKISNLSSKIFFRDHVAFDEVYLNRQSGLVGVSVSNLISDYDVDTVENILGNEEPWWYKVSEIFFNKHPTLSSHMCRLYINLDVAVLHQITLKEISEAIERSSGDPPTIICIYSPLALGIIDMYVIEKNIIQKDFVSINTSFVFISTNVIPSFDRIFIQGIPEIKSLFPEKIPVKSVYLQEVRLSEREFNIILHPIKCESTGIYGEHYARLLETVGLIITDIQKYSVKVVVPTQMELKPPNMIIQEAIDEEQKKEEKYEKDFPELLYPPTMLQRNSYLVYAEAEGSNLKALFERDDIDTTRTISNDPNEILEMLGIEAVRNFLITEFITALFMDKSYIDPRHIILMVDYQTYQGRLVPATYAGVQSQPIGALSKATFEKPLDIFKKRAPFGIVEEVSSVSAAVSLGSPIPLGTGKVEILPIEELLEKASKITPSELSEAIRKDYKWDYDADQKEIEIMFGKPHEKSREEFREKSREEFRKEIHEEEKKVHENLTPSLTISSKLFHEAVKNIPIIPCEVREDGVEFRLENEKRSIEKIVLDQTEIEKDIEKLQKEKRRRKEVVKPDVKKFIEKK